jgi:transposase, IS6 family
MGAGVSVSPSTILRWVVRYAEEFATQWLAFEERAGRSWRADETYPKVGGQWMSCIELSMNKAGRLKLNRI